MARIACAWLIKRHINPDAEFIFIPAGLKPLPDGAEPFDIPGTRFSHHRGHCSFITFLKEYKLNDPILQQIGQIVNEADVVQEVALEPAAPGLDVVPTCCINRSGSLGTIWRKPGGKKDEMGYSLARAC